MEAKRKIFATQSRAVGDRTMQFVISTGDTDREHDTIRPAGWDLAAFKRNPVVTWAHTHDQLPIGRATDVRVQNEKLMATVEFCPGDIYPFAQTVFEMLEAGFLNATSVEFLPRRFERNADGGVDFLEQQLTAFSVVPVPANEHALVVGRGANTSAVRKWFGERDGYVLTLRDDEPPRDGYVLRISEPEPRNIDAREAARTLGTVIATELREALKQQIAFELRRRRGIVDVDPLGDRSARHVRIGDLYR